MKKVTLILLLSSICFGLLAQTGTWKSRAALTFGRSTHVGFTLKGKGYICAGATTSSNLKDLWQYDPVTNAWSQKADMPGVPRQELASFVIGDMAYVGHGRNTSTQEIFASFNRYDPATNTWSAIADCPVKRFSSTGFSIDTLGYITCGLSDNRYKDLYAYNPKTNQWTPKASLPSSAIERSFACVTSVNHKAYLMGGYGAQITDDFYEYDPSADTWTPKASYPGGGRYTAAAITLSNSVLMGLGKDASSTNHQDWYYYTPANDSWTRMTDYPSDNVGGHATFVISGKGYVCAGTNKAGNVRDYLYELSADALGLNDPGENVEYTLNPYMASGVLYCNAFRGNFEMKVFDISGKQVFSQKYFNTGEMQYAFPLHHLSNGIYVAYFENTGLSKALKIRVD